MNTRTGTCGEPHEELFQYQLLTLLDPRERPQRTYATQLIH